MSFTCTLDLSKLPAEVQRGTTVRAVVTAIAFDAPIRSVTVAAVGFGVSQRLKKESENTFVLEIKVPSLVPPGNYQYNIWATNDDGENSARQSGRLVIK